ncbi:hypothetical protein E2562_027594 [Oryza meyeriana var. granulata]|uniref:Uncharacterized protein n=1 Tax=Oryza meyeriana var. granulata TaxID=110450 RepID=A0A6G1DP14_9ORYZ|nr:hypothetical protein E2562_027594 [Oryza meyeriana var. granulata]
MVIMVTSEGEEGQRPWREGEWGGRSGGEPEGVRARSGGEGLRRRGAMMTAGMYRTYYGGVEKGERRSEARASRGDFDLSAVQRAHGPT